MNKKNIQTREELPEIVLLGISHKTAPIEVREKFSIPEESIPHFLERAADHGIREIVYLATCNRVSVYFTSEDVQNSIRTIIGLFEEFSHLDKEEFDKYLYKKYSRDAVAHLLTVASSLDSMVIGENEIINQIKLAFRTSVQYKKTGMLLNRLFHQAFSTAKKVRTETEISQNPLSIAYIAAEQAKIILKDITDKKALLIGAGEMGELILKYLTKSDIGDITIANRSLHNAERIVHEINQEAHIIPLEDIENATLTSDIIITSAAMQNYIITPGLIDGIMQERMGKPLFMIDIAVPRNIDPALKSREGVHLYNIDDLMGIADENMKNRLNEVAMAEEIINADATEFIKWYEELEVVPIIVKIQNNYNELRKNELDRYRRRKLKHLSDRDFSIIEELTQQIMTKTLHNPIMAIKRYQTSKSNSHFDIETIVEELFKKYQ